MIAIKDIMDLVKKNYRKDKNNIWIDKFGKTVEIIIKEKKIYLNF